MRHLPFVLLLVFLSGCAQTCRWAALQYSGWSEDCIHGVTYYQFRSGAFVGYNPDGSIRKCKEV